MGRCLRILKGNVVPLRNPSLKGTLLRFPPQISVRYKRPFSVFVIVVIIVFVVVIVVIVIVVII